MQSPHLATAVSVVEMTGSLEVGDGAEFYSGLVESSLEPVPFYPALTPLCPASDEFLQFPIKVARGL